MRLISGLTFNWMYNWEINHFYCLLLEITGSNSFCHSDGSNENKSRIEDYSYIKVNSFNKPLSNACCLQGSVVYGSPRVNEKWMLPQGLITRNRRKSRMQMKDNWPLRNRSKVLKGMGGQGWFWLRKFSAEGGPLQQRNEPCCPLGSRDKGAWSGHASMTWALGGEGEALGRPLDWVWHWCFYILEGTGWMRARDQTRVSWMPG